MRWKVTRTLSHIWLNMTWKVTRTLSHIWLNMRWKVTRTLSHIWLVLKIYLPHEGEIHPLIVFRENLLWPWKPNQVFVLSIKYTFASLEKNPSTGSPDNIILRMNPHNYDLENRVKVTKTKSVLYTFSNRLLNAISASLVIIHPFLQEIWCNQVIFQHSLTSSENRANINPCKR